MAIFTVFTLLAFGVFGNTADVSFKLAEKGHLMSVPDFTVSSSGFSLLLGGLMGFITIAATLLTLRSKHTPMCMTVSSQDGRASDGEMKSLPLCASKPGQALPRHHFSTWLRSTSLGSNCQNSLCL